MSESIPEVEISFSAEERELGISEGKDVFIELWDESISGVIYSLSDVADDNLNYKATIVFKTDVNIIWNLVSVKVPVITEKKLFPINIITTLWDDIGTVKTLSGSNFNDVRVRLGEVFGEYTEIVSCGQNCEDLNIVMSDVSNFDENKFVIVEK